MAQILTEWLLLSAAGTLVGVAVACLGTGVLVRIMASGRAFEDIEIKGRRYALRAVVWKGLGPVSNAIPAVYSSRCGSGCT